MSPKHGYHFDGQEHDVRKSRVERPCQGGRVYRGSHLPGRYSENCTGTIKPGDIQCVTIVDLYVRDSYACLSCALAVGAMKLDLAGFAAKQVNNA